MTSWKLKLWPSMGHKMSKGKPPTTIAVKPVLMSREERLKLIRAPFQSQIVTAKSWGGVNVGNAGCVPTEGHRTWQLSAADESYLRYGKADDDSQSD